MGHYGVERTYERMKQRIAFDKMKSYVRDYIATCDKCILHKKLIGPKTQYQATNIPPNIFHTMSMDIFGPLPTSVTQHVYVLVVQCVLSRYLFIIPLKTRTATEVCHNLIQRVFFQVGVPVRLLMDNASEFTGHLIDSLKRWTGFRTIYVQTYRPQQNGMNERSHKELRRWLRIYFEQKVNYWSMVNKIDFLDG